MAISDKTRKFLWSKSGNRCAMCKIELFTNKGDKDDLNIGEECHIISSKKNGPRHLPNLSDYDHDNNLLLLCRNHHKEIDELTDTFTEELLRYIKTNHENWVRKTLNDSLSNQKENKPKFISRITSGKELFNIINGVYGYQTDYEDIKEENDLEFIGDFLQSIVDYGDISSMIEIKDHVKIGIELQKLIDLLDEKGFFLFAERGLVPMFPEYKNSEKWLVATIIIRKKENPEIIKVDLE
jgi:hypothetical protein